jgi:hypothetical protein
MFLLAATFSLVAARAIESGTLREKTKTSATIHPSASQPTSKRRRQLEPRSQTFIVATSFLSVR